MSASKRGLSKGVSLNKPCIHSPMSTFVKDKLVRYKYRIRILHFPVVVGIYSFTVLPVSL